MSDESTHIVALLPSYIDLSLDAAQRATVETHLQACESCDQEYKHLVAARAAQKPSGTEPASSEQTPAVEQRSEPAEPEVPADQVAEAKELVNMEPVPDTAPAEAAVSETLPASPDGVSMNEPPVTEKAGVSEASTDVEAGETVGGTTEAPAHLEMPINPPLPAAQRSLTRLLGLLALTLAVLGGSWLLLRGKLAQFQEQPGSDAPPSAPSAPVEAPVPETAAEPAPVAPTPAPAVSATPPASSGREFEDLRTWIDSFGPRKRPASKKPATLTAKNTVEPAAPASEKPAAAASASAIATPAASVPAVEAAPAPAAPATPVPEPTPTPIPARIPEAFVGSTGLPEWKGSASAIRQFRTVIVENNQEWKKLWQEHSGGTLRNPLPKVDFEQYQVVGVFAGSKPAGSSIEMTGNEETLPPALTFFYRETSPEAPPDSARIQPYHLWVIFKTSLPIQFKRVK